MGRLAGKIALVTGGTSGIGQAVAELFAVEGARVLIVGRNNIKGNAFAEKVNRHLDWHAVEFFHCDVTELSAIDELYKFVCKEYGKIDILFNNAGVLITKALDEITLDDWNKVYNTNVRATVAMTKKFIDMLCAVGGSIVNNASVAGMHSHTEGRRAYLYASSKAALIQFTKLCALNYANKIRVNCVCPGIIDTPIYTNRDYSRFKGIPMGRVGKPEELAEVVLFLVSNEASYLTGVILPVDGGSSLT